MHVKQLISLTLFTTLVATSYLSNESIAANAEKTTLNPSAVFSGKLIKTFNSGGYTYVHIATDNGSVWAAGPVTKIEKEDKVSFTGKIAMSDFYSKSLNRKFDTIYFVDAYIINDINTGVMTIDPHKNINKKQAAALKSFAKAENGQNIAEILKNKDTLAGKIVKVRGQVSKYTAQVMGKNWIHIRDNSSNQDISITTDASTKLDDIVLVEGLLVLNKDYGYGYVYEILVENAKVNVEQAK
ncbi:MAG: hypothetical protein GQ572_10830 [Gammaproteobacteria bacterium]|nr:hypothetical protein [Gammaproteobacteria bacterium]